MEIILCATQSHLATAWRDRIGSRLAATVRVVEGDILSLGVAAVVSPANSFGFMDGGLDGVYTRCFGPQLQQRLQRMIREQAGGELLVGAGIAGGDRASAHPLVHQRTDHARAHPAGYASPGLSGHTGCGALRTGCRSGKRGHPRHGDRDGRSRSPGGRRGHALGYQGCPLPTSLPGLAGGRFVVLGAQDGTTRSIGQGTR